MLNSKRMRRFILVPASVAVLGMTCVIIFNFRMFTYSTFMKILDAGDKSPNVAHVFRKNTSADNEYVSSQSLEDSFQHMLETGFPRNPSYNRDCYSEYASETKFCVNTSSQLLRDLYANLVKRLLQHRFNCHKVELPVRVVEDHSSESTGCFWIGVSNFTRLPTWPNSMHSSRLLLSLVPQLYQDYYWMRTKGTVAKQLCHIHSDVKSNSVHIAKVKYIPIKMSWRDFLDEFRRCDFVIHDGNPEIIYLALAFGIPVLPGGIEKYVVGPYQNQSFTAMVLPHDIRS